MRRLVQIAPLVTLCLVTAARAQTKIEPKYTEGVVTTQSAMKMHQVLSIAGQNVATDVETHTTARTTISKRQPDGTVRLEKKNEAFSVTLTAPGLNMVAYDSAKPETGKSDNPMVQPLLDGFRSEVGNTYTVVLGKDNQVTAVEGADKILAAAPPAFAASVKERYNPDKLKRDVTRVIARYPEGPVKKGDKWMRSEVSDIGSGQTLTFETYYEYLGTVEKNGKTLDKISIFMAAVKYGLAADSALPFKVSSSDLKVEQSAGSFLVDRETGDITDMSNQVHVTGVLVLNLNGMELPAKLDLNLDAAVTAHR
jgi:hypothetical protein